jgi:hypothetical protein
MDLPNSTHDYVEKFKQNFDVRETRGSAVVVGLCCRRKIASSTPDEFIGLYNLPNPSSRTMALVLTQHLKEMSTKNLPEGTG